MELDLTVDQRGLVDAFEQIMANESSMLAVRAAAAADGFDRALWKHLIDFGATDVVLPAEAGGLELGLVEEVLLAEVVGRHLACVPYIESVVAAQLLQELSGPPADDEVIVVSPRPAEVGVAAAVPAGIAADGVVVLDGEELVLARGGDAQPIDDLGFLGSADVTVRGAEVDRVVLASGGSAGQVWDLAVGRWRLGTAAVCTGVAERALQVAVDYVRQREQFGVPIGSFQAVQHRLAEVAMSVDASRLLAREAAWRSDSDLEWRSSADVAFAHAARTAVFAAESCLHVHGGYGYTVEYDAHLFLRRAMALQCHGGDPDRLAEQIGRNALQAEVA